ncbi:hypothetical protein N480_23165 [Pseudoalteromonas luteoviolacea S2607]|uniref:DUF3301 domain-containing protein n=1 Tax=Pseudoalteromonas luteoviolacea TaxID=43657 RepID=UPI0007B09BD6|nr:DUF3301 domain-containing protein [Pseudoalteromonas luteoviolacea]KZN33889.1 hypothetical protein N480_23165 [Pseudoalteromonas luteoviolacea S2607]
MTTLWLFILTLTACGFFWYSREIAEAAREHAAQQSEKLNVQLLSVACQKRRIGVLKNGKLGIKSQFLFEFSSDRDTAYKGILYLENQVLVKMDVPPHRIVE